MQEQVDAGCVDAPGQPPAEENSQSTTEINCDTELQVTTTTTTTTTTTEYVYDTQTNTWVLGEPVSTSTTDESPVQAGTRRAHGRRRRSGSRRCCYGGRPGQRSDRTNTGVLALLTLGGLLVGAGALRTRRA